MIPMARGTVLLAVLLAACQSRRLNSTLTSENTSSVRPIRSCEDSLSRTEGFPFSTLNEGPAGPTFREMAFYYSCASQEFNFEQGFRSSRISLKSFHSASLKNMRGLFDFPFWDIDFLAQKNVTTDTLGEIPFCANPKDKSCFKKRIIANPHDKLHVRVLSQAFGEPTGYVPAIMTSSLRTVLVLPPEGPAYFLKMPGQTLLSSPLKALKPEEVMESLYYSWKLSPTLPLIYPETAGILLKASFFLPDLANSVDRDPEDYFRQYPEDRYPRRYTLLKREFPNLRRLVKPNQKTLLLPGHSLLSKAFLESEFGKKIAGSTEGERFEWARRWIWPAVSKFIVASIFEHGIHFEAHFQNIDFLLALDAGDRVQDVAVLMKDLGDVIADPIVQIIQGKKLSEPILAAGPWANQHPRLKDAMLADKYGGKFGMLEPSEVFGRNIQHPEWAISLRRSLAESFASWTAQNGIPAPTLVKEKSLNDFIYAPQKPNQLPQLELGKSVANMRTLIVRAYVQRNAAWDNDASQDKKEDLVRRYLKNDGSANGMESDCALPLPFHRTFSGDVSKFRLGHLPFPGDPDRSITILALQNPDESIECLLIKAPIKTISLQETSEALRQRYPK